MDAIRPQNYMQFTVQDFINKRLFIKPFINALLDKTKMIQEDLKDDHAENDYRLKHPGQTDWERYSTMQYMRACPEEGYEGQSVLELEND